MPRLVVAVSMLLVLVTSGLAHAVDTLPSGKLAWNSYFGPYPNVPTISVPFTPLGAGGSVSVPGGVITITGPVAFNKPFRVQFTPADSQYFLAYDPADQSPATNGGTAYAAIGPAHLTVPRLGVAVPNNSTYQYVQAQLTGETCVSEYDCTITIRDGATHVAPWWFAFYAGDYLTRLRSTSSPSGYQLVVSNAYAEAQFDVVTNPGPQPPTAGFTYLGTGTPNEFNFLSSSLADAGSSIVRYDWTFGDTSPLPNGAANVTHRYTAQAASRVITLKVTDSNGLSASASATMNPLLRISQAPTDPARVNVGDTASLQVTVANDGPSTVSDVVPRVTIGPAAVAARSYAITPAPVVLQPGTAQTFTVPFAALTDGTATGTIDASGTAAGAPLDAVQRRFTFVIGNPGLLIDLSGSVAEVGRSFIVRMTVTNPGTDAVDTIHWAAPTGITLESGDDPPGPEPSVTFVRGPDVALPASLAPKQSVAVLYTFNAPFLGASVITAAATGATVADRQPVAGHQVMSVLVLAEWSESARDLVAIDGIERALGAQSDAMALLDQQLGSQITTAVGWEEATAAQVTSLQQVGLRRPGFDSVLLGALRSGKDQAVTYLGSWAEGLALKADAFGRAGGQTLADLWSIDLGDPVQRRLVATRLWEVGKHLATSTATNAGYLASAVMAAHTIDGLKTIVEANGRLATDVSHAVGEAMAGVGPLVADYARQYATDPQGAVRKLGLFSGEISWTAGEAGATVILGEAGMKAVVKAGAPLVKGAVSVFRAGGAVAGDEGASIAGAGLAGEDAAEAMTLRMTQAQQVVDNYQALPAGTVLDLATVTAKGGVLAEDARAIRGTLARANAKFGTEFELATRTSEPLSAGLDGIAKPEFVKPKAVSVLDQMMGADPARAGRVGLFDPVPLDPAVVARLDDANPGFALKYEERLKAQQKLWAEWQKPGSKLKVLTDAGQAYREKGGITVLNARPGNTVPNGLQYLEQLDEEAFLAANKIAPADVPKIRERVLLDSNIDTFKAAPVARVGPNGTVFIDEALSGKPFLSDLDIQSIAPKDGKWPPGVSRGQIETYFKSEMRKLRRYPFHGWSDAAIDLPSDYYLAAVPFQLGNADPALALDAANRVASRLTFLEKAARAKAAKLLAAGDTKGYLKLTEPFDELAGLKEPSTGLYSARALLKKYPPGEKTINFTAGDIRVGYGTGGR